MAELAKLLDHKPAEVIAKLFEMGMMATINQRLDMDTIEMVAVGVRCRGHASGRNRRGVPRRRAFRER